MGFKKYEIITVGGNKRVRALRSWAVGDRYVNIGDVGGIVYDEKTLSQDGACWLFKGNFGFPGARIGGDSIVDVGEATLSPAGTPNVDILGSSVVVGSKIQFESELTTADAVVLTADDFEQGAFGTYVVGQPPTPIQSADYIRTKNPIFLGGRSLTVKLEVPGYSVGAVSVDRDGLIIALVAAVTSGAGVTLTIPAGQYAHIVLSKDPVAATVPSDATAAQITFTGVYETSLSIIDSRLEVGPATGGGASYIRPGGNYTIASGVKYPEMIIRNSKVSIIVPAAANRIVRLAGQIIGSTATLYATTNYITMAGLYGNIKNITASEAVSANVGINAYDGIQATDCDNFAVSPTIFPELAAAQWANTPFIFQGCNVPDGRFYHHAQIANTYKNIDFASAQVDLGKATANANIKLVSSEVEGMYRIFGASTFGALVESHESVKSLNIASANLPNSYGTTIYKDAYLNGLFEIAGTNVFGNTMKHEASNTQNVLAVQGRFNATSVGGNITGVVSDNTSVCVPMPFRVNGSKGLTIGNLPAGFDADIFLTDANGIITRVQATSAANTNLIETALVDCKAFIRFKKTGGTAITPDDVKGITVTTYNGCRLVNTKATAAVIAGNVRVEDNATIIGTSVKGTGYFGGNSIIQAPPALAGQLPIEGAVYMSDNAAFTPVAASSGLISLLEMRGGAVFTGAFIAVGVNHGIVMVDNARFLGLLRTNGGFNMHGNSFVAPSCGVDSGCKGLLTLKDDARIENGSITASGYITLCGKYKQTADKTWTGKRVIDSVNAPEYDNNVKTQYDF